MINELHGLASRGDNLTPVSGPGSGSETKNSGHQRKVAQAARDAVALLEKTFTDKKQRIKSITSMGTVLDTMNFTNESASLEEVSTVKTVKTDKDRVMLLTRCGQSSVHFLNCFAFHSNRVPRTTI